MKGEESLMFLCWICLNLKLAYNLYKFGHLPVDIPKTQFHSINELYLSWEKECGRALRFIEFRKCKCSNKISRRVPNSCAERKHSRSAGIQWIWIHYNFRREFLWQLLQPKERWSQMMPIRLHELDPWRHQSLPWLIPPDLPPSLRAKKIPQK